MLFWTNPVHVGCRGPEPLPLLMLMGGGSSDGSGVVERNSGQTLQKLAGQLDETKKPPTTEFVKYEFSSRLLSTRRYR